MSIKKKKKTSDKFLDNAFDSEEYDIDADYFSPELLKFDFDINDTLNEVIYDFPISKQNNLLFCSTCILIASLFLCTVYTVATNSETDTEQVQLMLNHLRTTDNDYLSADSENRFLTEEIKELSGDALNFQEINGTVGDYGNTVQSLEKKLETLKSEFIAKNDELYTLNQEVIALRDQTFEVSTIDLFPGVYTVGKNIPVGTYNITGAGSLIVSTSAKEVRENVQLNESEATVIELKSGYVVKINRSTRFVLSASQ